MRPIDRFRNWRALACGVGVMGLLAAVTVTGHHMQMMHASLGGEYLTWRHAFFQEAPHWIVWALTIPVVYVFVDRVARRGWGWGPTVLAHLAFAAVAMVVATAAHSLLYGMAFGQSLLGAGATSVFTYGAILGGVLAYYYSQRFIQREVELAGARLGALQAQLRPHFMFNALNSVAMLVRSGRGPEAVEMIARVSDVLRDSLDEDERAEVSLAEEVALAQRYLAIEEVRFADRLKVHVDITEQAKAVRVPRLILQPVVENAVRHGIGVKAGAGRIEIVGRTAGSELIVTVRDDGPGPNGNRSGVGMRNVCERLRTAYGAKARFTLEHGEREGAVATIVIPLK